MEILHKIIKENNNNELVKFYLEEIKRSNSIDKIRYKNDEDETPLIAAADVGNFEVIKLLISCLSELPGGHQEIINQILHNRKDGTNAISWAAYNGSVEAIELFFSYLTALIYAAYKGKFRVVRKILSYLNHYERINYINHTNINNNTALLCASDSGCVKTVKLLLKFLKNNETIKAQLNHENTDGISSLNISYTLRHFKLFKFYLEHITFTFSSDTIINRLSEALIIFIQIE